MFARDLSHIGPYFIYGRKNYATVETHPLGNATELLTCGLEANYLITLSLRNPFVAKFQG